MLQRFNYLRRRNCFDSTNHYPYRVNINKYFLGNLKKCFTGTTYIVMSVADSNLHHNILLVSREINKNNKLVIPWKRNIFPEIKPLFINYSNTINYLKDIILHHYFGHYQHLI